MADDKAALDLAELVAEHHGAVYRYAFRLSGSVPDAEDLTQQVFLTAQQKLAQLRSPERVRNWLFAILRNSFLKCSHQRRPIPVANIQYSLDSIPSRAPSAEEIDRERLQQAIHALPPQYRLVLAMFYYENCSYREIAERLDLPMGTVMSRLARAKRALRSMLFPTGRRTEVGRQQGAATSGG